MLTEKHCEEISVGREKNVIEGQRTKHFRIEMDGKYRERDKCYRGCYETLRINEDSKTVAEKARRVNTYCGQCEGKPTLVWFMF